MGAVAHTNLAVAIAPMRSPWLLSLRMDLFLLLGGALLIPLPWLVHKGLGPSATLVNLALTALIGGPHLFATFTYTFMERRFWARHPILAAGGLAIPPLVIYAGLAHFKVLLGVFFLWASVHVLHQIGFLADGYRARSQRNGGGWERAVDYAVIFTSLYPLAVYKLVQGTFTAAGTNFKIPFVFGNPIVFVAALSLFLVALGLFVVKTAWEWKTGRLNPQKLALIALTVVVSFLLPLPRESDLVFQGFNAWHSLQYLAIVCWMNALRKRHCEISSPFVLSISGLSKAPWFYLSCLLPALGFLALIGLLAHHTPLAFQQCYFIVILSGLFIHYYLDHWVFARAEVVATFPEAGR